MTNYINGLSSIIDNYQIFLIDMSGVIHDGLQAYPNSLSTLEELKAKKKDIIFFTNAPRPQAVVKQKLLSLGYAYTGEKIITSGDLFLKELKEIRKENSHKSLAYILGAEKNTDLNLSDYYNITQNIEEAEVFIILTYMEDPSELDHYDKILKTAIKGKITAICPNPDAAVYHGNKLRYPAGYVANKYESLGGKVKYYGKPHISMYEFATQDIALDKSQIIAIGDNLNTDILGAKNFGIDSLLISKGIYKDFANLGSLIEDQNIFPTYICDYFMM